MMCGNRLQSPIMCIFSPTAASTPKARQTSSALQPMPLCASFSTLRPMAPLLFITQPRRSKPILVWLARRAGKDDADLIQFLQHCRARRFEQPGPRRLRRALFLRLVLEISRVFKRPRRLIRQIHFIGNESLLIIAVSGLFVGFVLGLQGYYTLNRYGAQEALGLLVALSLTRELGPVVTALLFAGRAGT